MNLRQIRTKIKAIDNIKKITNAMEMVSSIKMKKAQREYLEGKPYREFLRSLAERLIDHINKKISPLLDDSYINEKKAYVVIASNKGLCGSFNYFLMKEVVKILDRDKIDFIVWGKKASQFLYRIGAKIIADFSDYSSTIVVPSVFNMILTGFLEKKYGEVFILYNQFISAAASKPTCKIILPIKINYENNNRKVETDDYLIEPSPEILVDPLLRNLVELQIRDAILSSQASEHSARMIAMKNATDNAQELANDLTMLRNRVRQEKITYELLDMITAKESITSAN
jgi:F-type H+-transporting ATPase subunit gamma